MTTFHRSVITPPPKPPRPPSRLADIAALAAILALLLSPALLYACYLQAQDAAASRLQQLRERRVCPLSLEVQLAMGRGEQVRIVGDRTCEDPPGIVK